MAVYLLDKRKHSDLDTEFQSALKLAYERKERPGCLCQPQQPPEMYIALYDGNYVVKRMPDTGQSHHPSCEHFEAPPELSGRGELIGYAIRENTETGETTLSLGFSLSKTGNRAAPTESSSEADTVKTDGKKLNLKGFFHNLWEEAQFNRWSPKMEGKRNWATIHKYITLKANETIVAKKKLSELLFIPERYHDAQKEAINARRNAFMNEFLQPAKGPKRLAILLAEVNKIEPARFGHKLTIRQSNQVFLLHDDLHKRVTKRFETELALASVEEKGHLMIIATFSYSSQGYATIEEMSLLFTSEHWIPVEDRFELELVRELVKQERYFDKGLRYHLGSDKPVAAALLTDTPSPVALFIELPGANDQYRGFLDSLKQESSYPVWSWDIAAGNIPQLPQKHGKP